MIARLWRGRTTQEYADSYKRLLKERVRPSLQQIEGYRGGYMLRHETNNEVEFVMLNLFESLDAVKAFAESDYAVPVLEPKPDNYSQG
ncbi:MAG TPA: antibiotic biosynthesis monooxygenase [Terriglobales bacterium]|nr:antibiotic biosynthesis monooxygenase [Terriglobales bacterium]